MYTILRYLFILGLVGLGTAWWVTKPQKVDPTDFAQLSGDAAQGETIFWASGCASCHVSPGAEIEDRPVLAGGQAFPSDFGTFRAPNISMDPNVGIGGWSLTDFANAVQKGVSPKGQHYFPAFPYTSYARMTDADVADLWAFMQTLPADETASLAHEVGFPFNIRRSLGGWKFLFANDDWVLEDASSESLQRGRYLVEALGHCAECHTPRNALGGLDYDNWLAGAPIPKSNGRVPGISPSQLDWSESDLVYYFESGFTPDFDSAGGHMADVVSNLARLPVSDREAITAYLKALPTN